MNLNRAGKYRYLIVTQSAEQVATNEWTLEASAENKEIAELIQDKVANWGLYVNVRLFDHETGDVLVETES